MFSPREPKQRGNHGRIHVPAAGPTSRATRRAHCCAPRPGCSGATTKASPPPPRAGAAPGSQLSRARGGVHISPPLSTVQPLNPRPGRVNATPPGRVSRPTGGPSEDSRRGGGGASTLRAPTVRTWQRIAMLGRRFHAPSAAVCRTPGGAQGPRTRPWAAVLASARPAQVRTRGVVSKTRVLRPSWVG